MNLNFVKKILTVVFVSVLLFMMKFNLTSANSQIDFNNGFYENLFYEHGSVMLIIEPDSGEIWDANLAAEKFYGYKIFELKSMTIDQINTLTPDEIAKERQAAVNEERNYFVFPHRLKDGEIRTVEVHSYPVLYDGRSLLFSLITDITESITMQQQLENRQNAIIALISVSSFLFLVTTITFIFLFLQKRKNEREMKVWNNLTKNIIENSPSAIAVHDKDLSYVFVSKKYLETYRVKEKDVIGKNHYDVFPDLPEKWKQVHQRVLKGAIESADDDPFYREDGTIDYTRWQARPWYGLKGEISGFILYTEIINDWKNQIQAFKESEERFRLLVETAPEGIFLFSGEKLTYANKAGVQLVGAKNLKEILDSSWRRWLALEYHSEFEKHYKVFLERKLPIPTLEQTYVLPSGEKVDVQVRAIPIKYEGRDCILLYVKNITEQKRAQLERNKMLEKERHQQKLESIGTLASGVAHEINNPVTGIMNYAQLILDDMDPKCSCTDYAQEIITESKRIAEIVRGLLFFSRNEKQSHSLAEINDIIDRTLILVRTLMKKEQIEIKLDIKDDIPSIKCRSQQIQQVIMNLVTNARDSLNAKYPKYNKNKVIIISAYSYLQENKKWVRITVEDFGNGLPEEIQNRIFDPFFTTKPKEMGTGLGLPISYGIVKEHGGKLSFETEVGKYTKFHIDLPVDGEN